MLYREYNAKLENREPTRKDLLVKILLMAYGTLGAIQVFMHLSVILLTNSLKSK